jgi:hypothetical protein
VKRMRRKPLEPWELCDIEAIELLDGPPPVVLGHDNLRPYQLWMARQMTRKPAMLLGAQMGLGKTGATLRAVRALLDAGRVSKVLIVAPLKVAELTWPEEIRKWEFARPLPYALLTGPAEHRAQAALGPEPIHIINRELLVWLHRHLGRKWAYDMLVYDESSRLKSGSKRTGLTTRKDGTVTGRKLSEFGVLARRRNFFKRVVEMSGTPAPGGLLDLWGQFYILDRGKRLGTSKTSFQNRWFQKGFDGFSLEPMEHSHDEIMGKVKNIFVTLRSKDYLDLPPVVPLDVWVDLPPVAQEQYDRFAETSVLQEYDIEALNGGVLTNKLLQAANGSIYDDDGNPVWIHDAKLDALESIVADSGGAPIMICYAFKFDLDRIRKRFPKFRVFGESSSDMRDWTAGRIPGLLLHPASAGHGLNFQYGGNIMVWYGLNWSLELYQQAYERLPRSGQKAEHVFMYRILARKTYDVRQEKSLTRKGTTQDRITDEVRVYQDEIRRQLRRAA